MPWDAVMWAALDACGLADFLSADRGLDTRLKENASNLSGGQRQRLAMARAILHDSPILIFDEATSNIDVESEEAILEQIQRFAGEKTIVMITHRLANVKNADRIYVLESGRVAEYGTHDALVGADGVYARLWRTQQELEQFGKAPGRGEVSG